MIRSRLRELDSSQERYSKSYFGFLRNLATISVGLLGLLISLKPKEIEFIDAKICFLITITSLGLGILFCVISQYYDVYIRNEDVIVRRDHMYKELKGIQTDEFKFLPKPYLFRISEILTYIFLGLAVISLIVYVFITELK